MIIHLFHTPDTPLSVPYSRYPINTKCKFVSYRDDVLLVDDRLVKSEESDVILECGRVVRLVDGLAPDLVVLVGKLLALVSHIPLTKANLRLI